MGEIAIPTELNETGIRAAKYGLAVAGKLNLNVRLCHVIPIDYPGYGLKKTFKNETESPVIRKQMEKAEKDLLKIVKEIEKDNKNNVAVDFDVKAGFPADQIASITELEKTDLLLLTDSEDHSNIPGTGGEDLQVILEGSACPVLIMPPKIHQTPIKSILYTTEPEDADKKTLKVLTGYAARFKAALEVLYISDDSDFKAEVTKTGFRNKIREEVGYDDINVFVIPSGNTTDGIKMHANNFDINLIAFVKDNPGFWKRMLGKSTTEKLLEKTNIPILIFNEKN